MSNFDKLKQNIRWMKQDLDDFENALEILESDLSDEDKCDKISNHLWSMDTAERDHLIGIIESDTDPETLVTLTGFGLSPDEMYQRGLEYTEDGKVIQLNQNNT